MIDPDATYSRCQYDAAIIHGVATYRVVLAAAPSFIVAVTVRAFSPRMSVMTYTTGDDSDTLLVLPTHHGVIRGSEYLLATTNALQGNAPLTWRTSTVTGAGRAVMNANAHTDGRSLRGSFLRSVVERLPGVAAALEVRLARS